MAVSCSFFRPSMAFLTIRAPYSRADGSTLLIIPLVNGFHDGLRAVLLRGWQCIALSSLQSSTAFTAVCAPYWSADGSSLLVLLLVNGFHGLRAVLLSGRQRIAHSSSFYRLSLFARRFAQWMAAHSYILCSSTALPVSAQFCSVDGSGLLILPLINGFHGLCTVLLSRWLQITHSSARQWLSERFMCCVTQQMAAACLFSYLSTAFTVCTLFCSADKSASLILLFVNGFHKGLRAMLPSRWQRVAHSSAS